MSSADPKKRKASAINDTSTDITKTAKKIKDTKSAEAFRGKANINEDLAALTFEQVLERYRPTLERWHDDDVAEFKKNNTFTAPLAEWGVYVVEAFVNNANMANLAGYLNCPSTDALWQRFHKDQSAWEVLEALLSEDKKESPYDLTIPKPSLVKAALFRNLNQGHFKHGDVVSSDVPSESRFPRKAAIRMHLYFLRAAYKVITAVPASFPGPRTPQLSRKYVDDLFEAEDIYRFIVLWTKFVKVCVKKSEGKKEKSQELPRLAVFRVPDERTKNSKRQQALNLIAFENLQKQSRQLLTRSDNTQDQNATLDAIEERFRDITLSSNLPDLEGDDQRDILEHLAKKVTYLYKDREMRNRFFDPTSQTVEDTFHQEVVASKAHGELSEEERADFDKRVHTQLQQTINDCSAKAPDWERVVKDLGLVVEPLGDEEDALTKQRFRVLYRGLQLMPWQPQAVVFMLDMIEGPQRGLINADDMGLGKTIAAFTAMVERSIRIQARLEDWQAKVDAISDRYRARDGEDAANMLVTDEEALAHDQEVNELGPKPCHRPVLIAVPPSAVNAWTSDAANYFSAPSDRRDITIKTFYGKDTFTVTDRNVSPADKLTAWCRALDADAETTSRTCILATFGSYSVRCARGGRASDEADGVEVAPSGDVEAEVDGLLNDAQGEARSDDGDDVDDDQNAGEGPLLIPSDLFALVVIDEAHRVKNSTRQSKALYDLTNCAYILCTATPCVNSVRDLYGLLRFLWKAGGEKVTGQRPNQQSYADLADTFRDKYDRDLSQIPEIHRNLYRSALDPEHYKSILGSGTVDLHVGRKVVPLPMMMTCLKRVKGHVITVAGHTIQLGGEIPPPHISLAEVRFCDASEGLYQSTHHDSIKDGDGDGEEGDEKRSAGVLRRRRLQHAALCPQLDQMFCRNVGNNAQEIEALLRGIDSFNTFHTWTKSDPHHPSPESRISMAQYIAGVSPKLQALCGEILRVIVEGRNKLLIYAHWPLNLWLIELLLSVLQIKYVSIRAGISANRRIEAENEYNNNPAIQALVCSSRSAAESLNLQRGGWHTVIMDMVPINTILQIVGRTCRVGQRFAQQIKIFVADQTYDQYLLHKYFGEYTTQVAATSNLSIPAIDEERISEEVLAAGEGQTAVARDAHREALSQCLQSAYAQALARSIFGGRCTLTQEWSNVRDVYEKNLHPEQQLFRLATGRDVADEMLQQLKDFRAREQQRQLKDQELEEQELREREVSEGDVASREQPTTQIADPQPTPLRTTPFAAPMLARFVNHGGFSDRRHVWALIHAAEAMAGQDAYRLKNITARECLEAAKNWVENPSHTVDMAIAQLDRGVDGQDADGYLSESSTIADEEEVAHGDSPKEPTPMAIRSKEDSHAEEGDIGGDDTEPHVPQPVDELTPEQQQAHEKHLKGVRDLRTKPEVIKFALQEFNATVQGTREVCNSAAALLWVQKEIDEGTAHTPDWSEYDLKVHGKSKKKRGVDVAGEGSGANPAAEEE